MADVINATAIAPDSPAKFDHIRWAHLRRKVKGLVQVIVRHVPSGVDIVVAQGTLPQLPAGKEYYLGIRADIRTVDEPLPEEVVDAR